MSVPHEGCLLEQNEETSGMESGTSRGENQKGCWAATCNQVTLANTTLLLMDPFGMDYDSP